MMKSTTLLLTLCAALVLATTLVDAQANCRTKECFEDKLPLLHDKLNDIFNMQPPPKPAAEVEVAVDNRRKGPGGKGPPPQMGGPKPSKPPGGHKHPGGSKPQPSPSNSVPGGGPKVIAQLVRLAFHSCFMGCHGVVRETDPANAGITENELTIIRDLYIDEFEPFMSKADYWAAAGNFALIKGAVNANVDLTGVSPPLDVAFFYGRLDDTDGSLLDETRSIPHPHMPGGLNQMTTFFIDSFGMDQAEAVAIMGAHTLGRARLDVSGFNGKWTRDPNSLDNAYFHDMINKGWTQIKVDCAFPDTGCWQWVRSDQGGHGIMMMNVDMSMAEDIKADADATVGKSECVSTNVCGEDATGRPIVHRFAEDNDDWLRVFSIAWNKMVTAQGGENFVTMTNYKAPEYTPARRSNTGCATLSVPYFGICF